MHKVLVTKVKICELFKTQSYWWRFFEIIQHLWLLLPALLDLIGDFFLLGEMLKPLNVHNHFEGEG